MKQGCILSLVLFNPALERIARELTNSSGGAILRNSETETNIDLLAYADDADLIGKYLLELNGMTFSFKTMV